MKKTLLFVGLVFSCLSFASAQSDEYRKNEFFAGYSFNSFIDSDAQQAHGFEVAYTRNFRRYVGAKADFSAHFRGDQFIFSSNSRTDTYRYMGGIQVKDNKSEGRFKPFAHALAGGGTLRVSVSSLGNNFSASTNAFAIAVGGGLDIKVNDRISIRAGQVDYAPLFRDGDTLNGVRASAGIVFHK